MHLSELPRKRSEKSWKDSFPERVSTQLRLPIPNWDGAYSTDFTISFPSIGVWIDVEIDEPYDYKTSYQRTVLMTSATATAIVSFSRITGLSCDSLKSR
jgi:hypothetical protein